MTEGRGEAVPTIDQALLDDALAYIDRWVEYRQQTLKVPGVAIGVGFQGRTLLARAHGFADLERSVPLTPDHIFRIASHSKMFTATAVMQLVEKGRLRLDDRLGDHLSWLSPHPGSLGGVTIRDLLSHAGGVIRDGGDASFWDLEREFPHREELRKDVPLIFERNLEFKYSNVGFAMVGLAIEAVTSVEYNSYVQREIIDRLGLRDTGPELDDHARPRLATGYTASYAGLPRHPVAHLNTRAMSAATGFYSTVDDLCRFGYAQCVGNPELLAEESKREMHRDLWSIAGSSDRYGLGFLSYQIGGQRLVGHVGRLPGFVTSTRFDPQSQLVVTALTNSYDGPAVEITAGMVEILNRALTAAKGPAEFDPERFVGRWWSLWGPTDVVRFGDELLGLDPEAASPLQTVAELKVAGPDTLTIAEDKGTHHQGEQIHYQRDASGRAVKVRWAGNHCYDWTTFTEKILPSVQATGLASCPDSVEEP